MRILMLSDDFLPNPGGIAAHVFELSKALGELGHEVDLIVGHREDHEGELPPLGSGVRVLSHRAFAWRPLDQCAMALTAARAIERARRDRRYDLCHWHNLIWESCAVAAAARGMPRVFTNHSSGYLRRAKSKLRLHGQLRLILSLAHRVIAPSRELLERSADSGYPRGRLHYIPNGVDTRAFYPGPADPSLAKRYGVDAGGRVVIVPRRLDPKNGVDVLVRAVPKVAREIPQLKVLLVGDGQQRAELEALVRELGVERHVVFCGSKQRFEMLPHLQLGWVACLPSRMEAVSLAGLEAMAAGLPVVGSNVGGIPEFVREGETGALVPADDPEALATALATLLAEPERCRAFGAAARESVEAHFSWHAAARRTLEVYAAATEDFGRTTRAAREPAP